MADNEYLTMLSEIQKNNKVSTLVQNQKQTTELIKQSINSIQTRLKQQPSLKTLEAQFLKSKAKTLANLIEKDMTEAIKKQAGYSTGMHQKFLQEIGWKAGYKFQDFDKMFGGVSEGTLRILQNGQLYKDGIGLSSRIYKASSMLFNNVNEVVTVGIASGQSAASMAKVLEKYIKPSAHRTWDKAKIKSILGSGYANKYKNIEYNSLRLARTTITHTATLGDKLSAKKVPFLEKFIWHSVFAHGRTCQECMDRDNTIYTIDSLPYDHPNGLCYNEPYLKYDLDYYSKKITEWKDGNGNVEMDNWFTNTLGNKASSLPSAVKATTPKKKVPSKSINSESSVVKSLRNRTYRRFETDADYDGVRKKYKKWANNLDVDEEKVITEYTEMLAGDVNSALRRGNFDDIVIGDQDKIKMIDRALDKGEAVEDFVAHRGVHAHHLDEKLKDFYVDGRYRFDGNTGDELLEYVNKNLVGTTFEDKGYVSTTIQQNRGFDKTTKISINVPKGSKGAYVEDLSEFPNEKEFLLSRDSKFQVVDAKFDKYAGVLELEVDLIEQAGQKYY